jgi:hypothetical protein
MINGTKEFKEKVLFYENNIELPFREKYVTITKEVLKLCKEYKKIELLDNVTPNKLEKAKIIAIKVTILQCSLARLCNNNAMPDIAEKLMKPLEKFMEEKSSGQSN